MGSLNTQKVRKCQKENVDSLYDRHIYNIRIHLINSYKTYTYIGNHILIPLYVHIYIYLPGDWRVEIWEQPGDTSKDFLGGCVFRIPSD